MVTGRGDDCLQVRRYSAHSKYEVWWVATVKPGSGLSESLGDNLRRLDCGHCALVAR